MGKGLGILNSIAGKMDAEQKAPKPPMKHAKPAEEGPALEIEVGPESDSDESPQDHLEHHMCPECLGALKDSMAKKKSKK